MSKFIYFLILTLTTSFAFGQNNIKKETTYNAHIKCISFNEDFAEIGYLESKEFRPLYVSQSYLTNEIFYQGKPTIEFVSIKSPQTTPSELDIINQKKSESFQKVTEIGEQYNQKYLELKKALNSVKEDGNPDIYLQQKIDQLTTELKNINEQKQIAETAYSNLSQKHISNLTRSYSDKVEGKSNSPTKPTSTPAPVYEPFASFNIPTSGGRYILIFNKTPNSVTISPLNDAPGIFPFGSYQFINLTGITVELRFGSKVIPLSPNGRTVFKPETANGEYIEGEFWTKVDDEFKLGYKFRKLFLNEVRTLAFIMPTAPGQSALNLKIAEERGQAEPPPADNSKSKDKKAKESEKKESENRPFG
jgi:hypothetical protein